MTWFVIWATLCALGAATLVALPLIRRQGGLPPQPVLGISAGLLVVLCAGLLYPKWSNYPWRTPQNAGGSDIATLLSAATQDPDDIQAWLNLGRGYLRIPQYSLARRSFQHADRLSNGSNAAALSGIAETMVLESDGNETPAAMELFDRALQLDPHSPQALFYTGVTLLRTGHLDLARARFVALRDSGPPPQIVAALDKQIAAIDEEIAKSQPDPATAIHLRVRLAPALAGKVTAGAALFVFVRAPQGGPPLAVRRLAAEFPQEVVLSANDSMIPSNRLKPGQHVQVMARVSIGGTPTATAGDLYGEITAFAGVPSPRELAIDRRTQ